MDLLYFYEPIQKPLSFDEEDLLNRDNRYYIQDTQLMAAKATKIYNAENQIDPERPVYLITWMPKPSELPKADFNTQHLYLYETLIHFLQTVHCGAFCVEDTQLGNPHYHGWYQPTDDPDMNTAKRIMIKTMQRFGDPLLQGCSVKIAKATRYRIAKWTPHANCLFYYKKDLLQNMLRVDPNPITRFTPLPTVKWHEHGHLFWEAGRFKITDLEDKISQREFWRQFYTNSIN